MPLELALAQVDPCTGDLAGNAAQIHRAVADAAAGGARLVLTPELALTGGPLADLAARRSFRSAADDATAALARDLASAGLGRVTVVVGTLGTAPDGRPTNAAAVLADGRVTHTYAQRHLPADSRGTFAPGDVPVTVEVEGRRIGLAIDADLDSADVRASYAEVDALAVLSAQPFAGPADHLLPRAAAAARRLGRPVLLAERSGAQDELVFAGGSLAVAADGRLAARSPLFAEHLLHVTLPEDPAAPPRGEVSAEERSDVGQVYAACVAGLRGYARKNGFRSVVLGLSGGIDSALVAAIAADAVGGENVVGVAMPSAYSTQHSRDDAADSARVLGLDHRTVPIAPMVDAFTANLTLTGVAEENLQARVRGIVLMGISNMEGHLVLATGNKSEISVGYSTIYGDAVGGYAPIKDVSKSLVWELSRWRNAQAEAAGEPAPIPWSSITKPPSAELRPGQQDSDSLPPYDVLDPALRDHVEGNLGRPELLDAGHAPEVVDRVLALVDRAEWKRRQYPPGPKVTPVALGHDRRLPMTSRWREQAPAPTPPSPARPSTPPSTQGEQ